MSNHLLHPELFELIPFTGNKVAQTVDGRATEVAELALTQAGVSVVVRALNEAPALDQLLHDVSKQQAVADIELIVVDNESSDHTADVARDHGATVVTLPRNEFSYPKSMNLGMDAASYNDVFLTVAHARLSNDRLLKAGSHHFDNGEVGGAFSPALPNANASNIERSVAIGTPSVLTYAQIKKAGIGVLGATNAMVSKRVWRELGKFDERCGNGGEDTLLAKKMLESGLQVVRDPALAVHHTHGLNTIDYMKQVRAWTKMAKGDQAAFDRNALKRRRPDLSFD